MKTLIFTLSLLVLTGCSVPRQAKVSDASATTGVVRLSYGQALLQNAWTDTYVAQGTATRACQDMGFANAVRFGQPVSTCSVWAGPLCINTTITLAYQCQGVAFPSARAHY